MNTVGGNKRDWRVYVLAYSIFPGPFKHKLLYLNKVKQTIARFRTQTKL